jgi:hypothetical protein
MTHFFSMTLLGVALIVSAAPGLDTIAQTDVAGTWILDANLNEGMPDGFEQTMTVIQSGDRIEAEIHTKTPNGSENRLLDVYVLDGHETDFAPPVPSGVSASGMRTSRWLEGHSGFESTERATVEGPEGEIIVTASRRWTLASDGNTLTVEMTVNNPQGESMSTRVFTRQNPAAEK